MSLIFKSRSLLSERMDTEFVNPEELSRILRALEFVNLWLGGVRATLWHLKRFSRFWTKGQTIRIVDWGTGGADIPRAIARWARRSGFAIEILGLDNQMAVLDYARSACREYPEIRLMQGDLARLSPLQEPFDYAISSLCLHHLSDETIVDLLQKSDRFTQRGMIMNDLRRSARAWAWIWTLTRILRAPPIIQYDGPLSVRRAFTQKELGNYAQKANVPYAKVYNHFGYRLTLAGEKI
jgi:ubiquinone/menaquinone biosynthesis C-methylase UbiE